MIRIFFLTCDAPLLLLVEDVQVLLWGMMRDAKLQVMKSKAHCVNTSNHVFYLTSYVRLNDGLARLDTHVCLSIRICSVRVYKPIHLNRTPSQTCCVFHGSKCAPTCANVVYEHTILSKLLKTKTFIDVLFLDVERHFHQVLPL